MSSQLTPTARVILGMLALGRNTGYEIKQFVDKSTRHFWAASYGQIYPELRRLEQQGLVESRPEPAGGRSRTVFELTDPGRQTLREWLQSTAEPLWELRSETMLKLFFSDAAEPADRIEQLRVFRELQERKLAQLHALEQPASTMTFEGPRLSLELGMALTECLIGWCREAEQRLCAAAAAG